MASPYKQYPVKWDLKLTQDMADCVSDQALINGVTKQQFIRTAIAEKLRRSRRRRVA